MSIHGFASWIWSQLRPFLKLFIRIIIRLESRAHKHSETFELGITYVYERLEIPILLAGVFFGTILAFITGTLAGIILLPFAIAKSWPIVTTFAPQIGDHLWQSTKVFPSSVFTNLADLVWPGTEPQTAAVSGSMNSTLHQRRSEQPFFLSDGTIDNRSSDEMEDMQGAPGASWKVSDTVEMPQFGSSLTSDLRISSSPVRRHRRTGTGSSSLSVTSSPELIRTPLIVNREGGESYHRRHRSGSSSPETTFRMTTLNYMDRTQSASDLRTHRRSGSSSVGSTKSQGVSRA